MGRSKSGSDPKEIAELRRRIVELRDQDWSFRQIAAEVGRDYHTVWDHYQRAMKQIPAAAIEQHEKNRAAALDAQLRRIDMQREVLEESLHTRHPQISNGHLVSEVIGQDEATGKPIYGEPYEDHGPRLAAAAALDRLEDREAKLLGLYPKQTIAIERTTSALDQARIDRIEAAKARIAARDATP
ncbi:MAG TPA: sigma factor-like helix-turn-helix DNA-binding protein [Mycobacterium sp.]|nr:sigma factor-like helix-turn-helix DNA-binding protein [Mycobacterium sp.]